jgi:hypothetical protein
MAVHLLMQDAAARKRKRKPRRKREGRAGRIK